MALGEASAAIDLATLAMHTRRDESMAVIASGRPITADDIMRNRRDIAYATAQLRQGVEKLAEVLGSRIVYDSDPLQPLLRDILTISTHSVVHRQRAMVPYGRMLLGFPPGTGEA